MHRWGVVVALVLGGCAADDVRPLAAAQLGDVTPRRLVAPAEREVPRASAVSLQHTQALDRETALVERPQPHRTRSRAYWFAVDASELAAGVELPTTAPGAIVRLQPLDLETRAAAGLDPAALVLTDAAGTEHAAADGMVLHASWEQLRDADVGLAAGTTAFAIDPAIGHGAFTLRTGGEPAAPRYLVHVAERGSALVLGVRCDRDAALWGDAVGVEVELGDDAGTIETVAARVRAPTGEVRSLELAPLGDHLRGELVLDELQPSQGALWTVEVDARVRMPDGTLARRSGRTAFGYGVPTAALTGELRLHEGERGGLEIALPLEIAAGGRYAVGGTLWGRDALGQSRPVALAQTAAWLEPGTDELVLTIDETVLARSQVGAPYQLRDLRLVDQGRVAVLHRQAFAALLD